MQEQLGLGPQAVHELADLLQAALQEDVPASQTHLALLLLCHVRSVQLQQSYRYVILLNSTLASGQLSEGALLICNIWMAQSCEKTQPAALILFSQQHQPDAS